MGALDSRWRAEREAAQQAALPRGRVAVSCSAPFGGGGLGRHLQELWGALGRAGSAGGLLCGPSPVRPDGEAPPPRTEIEQGPVWRALQRPMAISPAWGTWGGAVAFDAAARRRLPKAEHLLAFNGQALAQLRAARRAGYDTVSLVSATAHMRHVARGQQRAYRRHPLERPWAPRVLRRNLAEYALADTIFVSSEHIRRSFLAEGHPEERLRVFPLTPHPRYRPAADAAEGPGASFDVVYVGGLSVAKGVALLVDSVRRLQAPDLRLVLVGGWASRGMRRFLAEACAADPRIVVRLGDPLPHLQRARLYAHPSYDDGFGYAPCEAMAVGVPVIVTEDTGMKELIDEGRDGVTVPTGDEEALAAAIEAAYRREILTV